MKLAKFINLLEERVKKLSGETEKLLKKDKEIFLNSQFDLKNTISSQDLFLIDLQRCLSPSETKQFKKIRQLCYTLDILKAKLWAREYLYEKNLTIDGCPLFINPEKFQRYVFCRRDCNNCSLIGGNINEPKKATEKIVKELSS